MRPYHFLLSSVLLVGCATVPKPQELVDLEKMREGQNYQKAQEQQTELVAASDQDHQQSLKAWEDDELEQAKHWAVLGSIKLRTAVTMIEQKQAQDQLERLKKEYQASLKESADLEAKNKETAEKIRLYEQLSTARHATQEKEKQLSEAQRLSEAQKSVSNAQLALKMADTVEAAKYATSTYDLAQTMLNKATEALKAGNGSDAASSADLAKTKAEEAYQTARVLYLKDKEAVARQAQNQGLQRDAAAISGVTVKLRAAGQTQQLILPIPDLFKARSTSPRPDKLSVLNAIGELLKKYPSYPAIINGYTSFRVPSSQRFAVSQTRGQQVVNHFVTLGLPFNRFAVSGLGADNLIARNYSTANDRVEIVLLFE
jgi:outer membrane protein OmpA-like peptidoglycan-associated protein